MQPIIEEMTDEVARFHKEVTGQPRPDRPTQLSLDRFNFAMKFMREELDEFELSYKDNDLAKQADALVDLVYVALGRLLEMGIPPRAAFDEVQRANMLKKPGTIAKRDNAAYDSVKPEGWAPPDISRWLSLTRKELDDTIARRTTQPVPQPAAPKFGLARSADQVQADAEKIALEKKRAKVPLSFVPIELIQPTARVFQFGAIKYSRDGYKTGNYTYTELIDPLLRHAHEFLAGKDYDLNPETAKADEWKPGAMWSGAQILGHMGCCLAMLAYKWKHQPQYDDRRYEYDDRFRSAERVELIK